jgi:N-acetylglucosaminyldiphosphoundecaprenol N-acetyl-beta-D-mannosaminyltransferase
MPVVWASRLLGAPLPQRVAGSDLIRPLAERAAHHGWRVYLLGGNPGVADQARRVLLSEYPSLQVVGVQSPRIDLSAGPDVHAALVGEIRAARPDLVLVALGAPKQEIWSERWRDALSPAVLFGIGGSLDFIAGTVPRAPRWVGAVGLEWFYRFAREPRRLWRRYFVRDPRFVSVLWRTLRTPQPAQGSGNGGGT